MKIISLSIITLAFVVLSCNNNSVIPEDKSEDNLNVDFYESLVTSFRKITDSLTGQPGMQKIFMIDKGAIRSGNFRQVDSVFLKRILNGIKVKEGDFLDYIDPKYGKVLFRGSTLFYYDTLTDILKDTSYVIYESCNDQMGMGTNMRLYLIRLVDNELKIKLLSDFSFYDCAFVSTISALVGDSIIYTYKYSSLTSDIITDSGAYSTQSEILKKYNLINDTYYAIDSTRTEGY